MKNTTVILIAILSLLIGCKSINNLPDAKLSLIDTTWSYKDSTHDWEYEITFLNNGKIKSTHPNESTPDNDKWSQDKTSVVYSFNNDYSIYTGQLINSNTISGEATNTVNEKWNWTLTRKQD